MRKNNTSEKLYKINHVKFVSFLNFLILAVLYFVMAQALIEDNGTLMTLSVIFTIGYCVVAKTEYVFYVLCGITMFENVFKVSGDIAWFIPLLIFAFKLLFKEKFRFESKALISLLSLFALELLLDFSNGSMGQLLVNLATIIFIFVAFQKINTLRLNAFNIVLSLFIAFLAIIYYLLTMYGGIGIFVSSFMSASYAYRFGHSYGDTIGGAMAIPLYTTMIISCGLACYLKADKLSFRHKVIVLFAIIISMVFGAMTISRSFYLGLIATVIAILIFKSSNNKKHIKGTILFFVIVLIAFLLFTESDIINKIFSNLQLRLDAGMEKNSDGRGDIWLSCISYLLNHPLRLIFGIGASNYTVIGAKAGEYFDAGAHNLFIDFLMSWGLVGTVILFAFLTRIIRRLKNNSSQFSSQSLIPLITYVCFAMTALRSCSLKTWIFLLIAYVFINEDVYRNKETNL